VFSLKNSKVPYGCLADVLLEGDDCLTNEVAQPCGCAAKRLVGRPVITYRNADGSKTLVGFESVNGLLTRRGDLPAGDFEPDFTGHQHRRHDVPHGIRRPTKGWLAKVVQQ